MKCSEIIESIRRICPENYAESWDNVGLLAGNPDRQVKKVMLALDATGKVIDAAIENNVDMLITHHPMIFSAIKKITGDNFTGRRIISLIENRISYYAAHTNFDVCCMADLAAGMIGMSNGSPLEVTCEIDDKPAGIGKVCDMPVKSVKQWADDVKEIFGLEYTVVYGDKDLSVSRVAISPGAGKSMIGEAINCGVQLLITGDIGHHDALDAIEQGLTIIDAGHYGLEHIFIDYMKKYLEKEFENLEIEIYKEGIPGKII